MRLFGLLLCFTVSVFTFSQRGKDGSYTVTGVGEILNAYTYMTADVAAGSFSITVNDATMNNAFFGSNLGPGDLVFIHQPQGIGIWMSDWPITSGFDFTAPTDSTWGRPEWYLNSGHNEFIEVASVSGNTITFNCALRNWYDVNNFPGHVQIVRVPRLDDLTIQSGASLTAPAWDGDTGGEVILEIDGDFDLQTNASIDVSSLGFRGGEYYDASPASFGIGQWGINPANQAGRKGEGAFGNETDLAAIYSQYGKGAAANGGGGGNGHNAGGGGGANAAFGIYTNGIGVPDPSYADAWEEENPAWVGSPCVGGGRGGYTASDQNLDPNTTGPDDYAWGSDGRRTQGGLGGWPLDYSTGRIWFGGGGGAGDGNDGDGGSGGNGGGLVYILSYGNITGDGEILANGEDGGTTEQTSAPPWNGANGADGAGGAGAGGSIFINGVNNVPNSITIRADGGTGGDNFQRYGVAATTQYACGPGGGGGGGYVAISGGSPTITTQGGTNGTSTGRPFDTEFPPNGATSGFDGISSGSVTPFDIDIEDDTICGGGDVTLNATIIGALPAGATQLTWWDAQIGGSVIGTGNSITLTGLVSNTTVYVGTCPGSFRKEVNIIVSPAIVISGTATVMDTPCNGSTGSITGLTASGGTGTLVFDWNGTVTGTEDLLSAAPGSYTLTVTDANGCTETSGPYTVSSISGPSIDSTNYVLTPESCAGNDGSITGITATGTATLTYDWNTTNYPDADITDATTGVYWLYVTDGNGCVDSTGPYNMTQVAGPTIDSTNYSITNSACNGNTGSITGITASGAGVLTYSWNGVASAGPDGINLAVGNYTLVVTDGNGCQDSTGLYFVGQQNPPVIDSTNYSITNTACNTDNGGISGITTTGNSPFTFEWNGTASASEDVTGLGVGTYTLVVTDVNGCVDSTGVYTIDYTAPPTIDSTNYAITNTACTSNTGGVSGIVASGNSPFTFEWNGTTFPSEDATGLGVGTYTLVVTDANGCVDSTGVYTIGLTPPPTIDSTNYSIVNSACTSNTGEINGIVASGNGPFTFEWNGTTFPSEDATGLAIGTYTLVVTDANGCVDSTGIYTIGQQNPPVIDSTNYSIVNTACDTDNGQINGITVSGTSPFTYEWNGIASGSIDASGLAAGTYTLVVTDAGGCVDSTGIYTVGYQSPPVLDTTAYAITDKSCIGDDATITGITVTGNSPYTYYWNGTMSATIDASGLGLGDHTLVVVDANGCSDTTGVYTVVQAPDPTIDTTSIVITNSDCTVNTGAISGVVANGNGPFTYYWDGVAGPIDATGLAPGLHELVVVDANGCDDTLSGVIIGTLNGPVVDDTGLTTTDDHCSQGIGSISGLVVSAGTPGYTYAWDNNGGTSLDATGLDSANYTLTVTDAAGCVAFYGPVTINDIAGPVINETSLVVTDDFCDLNNGIITGISVTGSSPFSYLWSNGDTTVAIIGLSQGNYTLTVTDAFGCTATSSTIPVGNSNPNPIDFTWSPNPVTTADPNVTFTGLVTGNYTGSYWDFDVFGSDTGTVVNAFMDVAGTYPVTFIVEFGPGCADTMVHTVTVVGTLRIPNVITANGDGMNDEFYIEGLLPNTQITILNRWGIKVYESDNYDNKWDGTDMGGLQVSDGEYFYVIIDPMDETYQGSVRIITK